MAKDKETPPPAANDEYPDVQGTVGTIPNEPNNGFPSHSDIQMAVNEQVKWNEKRAKLNAEISGFRKGLKLKGFTLAVLDAKVKMLEWTPEEVKTHHAEQDWYAEAMRYPIGSQLELYGGDNTPDPVREQLRWRNIGFKDGLAGRGWADQAPDGCAFDCVQSYGEGHEEGQATVRRAFELRMTAANLPDPEADNDAEDDTEHQQDATA